MANCKMQLSNDNLGIGKHYENKNQDRSIDETYNVLSIFRDF